MVLHQLDRELSGTFGLAVNVQERLQAVVNLGQDCLLVRALGNADNQGSDQLAVRVSPHMRALDSDNCWVSGGELNKIGYKVCIICLQLAP